MAAAMSWSTTARRRWRSSSMMSLASANQKSYKGTPGKNESHMYGQPSALSRVLENPKISGIGIEVRCRMSCMVSASDASSSAERVSQCVGVPLMGTLRSHRTPLRSNSTGNRMLNEPWRGGPTVGGRSRGWPGCWVSHNLDAASGTASRRRTARTAANGASSSSSSGLGGNGGDGGWEL